MPNHVQPKNLHQAITIGLERAIRDFGVDLTDCTPSTLTGHVIRELKRIPGWRPPARLIKTPEELDALQPAADIIRAWDEDQTIVVPALIRCDDTFVFERATTPLPQLRREQHPYWWRPGGSIPRRSDELAFPVTVLHEPEKDGK